jgi:hypothetical protein
VTSGFRPVGAAESPVPLPRASSRTLLHLGGGGQHKEREDDETVCLTRQRLYELVWSKPMTEIAVDFGMSDVAFAKHCKKLNVPVLWRGYWQRFQSG